MIACSVKSKLTEARVHSDSKQALELALTARELLKGVSDACQLHMEVLNMICGLETNGMLPVARAWLNVIHGLSLHPESLIKRVAFLFHDFVHASGETTSKCQHTLAVLEHLPGYRLVLQAHVVHPGL